MRLVTALLALAACSHGASPDPVAKTTAAPEVPAHGNGRVVTESFHSDALGVDKDVVIYLPAGYDASPDKHWPVLYYLNGLTGDETNWTQLGHLDQAADKLGLGAIVVMPDGDNNWYTDSSMKIDYEACLKDGTGLLIPTQPRNKTCVKRSAYETYITKDLLGWVDRRYRTIARRDGRGIAGLSMGGFGAMELSMRHQDLFAAAASHSGVVALMYNGPFPYEKGKVVLETEPTHWGTAVGALGVWVRSVFGTNLADWQSHDPVVLIGKLEPGKLALYLDCGTEDDFLLNNGALYVHDLLLARHLEHEFFLGPGRHDFAFWSQRVGHSLAFLAAHLAHPS